MDKILGSAVKNGITFLERTNTEFTVFPYAFGGNLSAALVIHSLLISLLSVDYQIIIRF